MKKILVSAFALAMLGSSVAFADASKLSAFQGVETAAVSAVELDQVSGEGILSNLLSGLLNGLLSGLLGNVLGDVLGTVTTLNLLEGVTVDTNTTVNTGNLLGGVTGVQQIDLGISIH